MPIGPEPFLQITEQVTDKSIKLHLHNQHLKEYRNTTFSEKGKIPLEAFLKRYKYSNLNITGKRLKWLSWLFTGHSPLAYFQHRSNNSNFDSPYCETFPGVQETSEHFLCDCIRYMTPRLRIFGKALLTVLRANPDAVRAPVGRR